MTPGEQPKQGEVSLEEVFELLQHWRNNKSNYSEKGVPNKVWQMVFKLEQRGYQGNDLRRMFRLNKEQYSKKKKEFETLTHAGSSGLGSNNKSSISPADSDINSSAVFAEVSEALPPASAIPPLNEAVIKTQQVVSKLKSTANRPQDYLDTTTIIVEYSRPDGHRLTIHTTNDSIDQVMSAFAKQDGKHYD